MKEQAYRYPSFRTGVCYYPEHWDEKLWRQDLERMKDCGIEQVRVAEFAWNLFEMQEGQFAFDVFDRFLALCAECGMQVIFCTPTATPPAWLTKKYPEVLNVRSDGVSYRHGGRRHYNYNSAVYRAFSARITEKLAQHYGSHPAIIGWQLDNEFNCETSEYYSDCDAVAFRTFVQEKYGTLQALNAAWGTMFWNQIYTSFDEVDLPRPNPVKAPNPHLYLDYLRFISESTLSFAGEQAKILKKYIAPGVFVTTNGMFGHMDNHRLSREILDIYHYDNYPSFASAGDPMKDRACSEALTRVRSVCPHFGIMEEQSGAGGGVNWYSMPMPQPGQIRLWAMQAVAHGAEMVSFFRWRTAPYGNEIYWHGILDYDSRDNRRLTEVRDFAACLKKIAPVHGSEFSAAFGLLQDYDNAFDAELDTSRGTMLRMSERAIFEASQYLHVPYDRVNLTDDTLPEVLSAYSVLIYPHASIMTEKRATLLQQWVENGGTLLLGCRAGFKDLHGRCPMREQPGLLQGLTATRVKEFTMIPVSVKEPAAVMDGERLAVPYFNDILQPLAGARVLAVYDTGWYRGEAALTEHAVGKGRVLHFGSVFEKDTVGRLFKLLGVEDHMAPYVDADSEIQTVLRVKEEEKYLFLMNYSILPRKAVLKVAALQLQEGRLMQGCITVPPRGVYVLQLK